MKNFGHTNEGNHHGTLSPINGDRVHIQYTTGARAWETPTVARVAIERGQARAIRAAKMTASRKK